MKKKIKKQKKLSKKALAAIIATPLAVAAGVTAGYFIAKYVGKTPMIDIEDVDPIEPVEPTPEQKEKYDFKTLNGVNDYYWSDDSTDCVKRVYNDVITFLSYKLTALETIEDLAKIFPDIQKYLEEQGLGDLQYLDSASTKATAGVPSLSFVYDKTTHKSKVTGSILATFDSDILDPTFEKTIGHLSIEVQFDLHNIVYQMVSQNDYSTTFPLLRWWAAGIAPEQWNQEGWKIVNKTKITLTLGGEKKDDYNVTSTYDYDTGKPEDQIIDFLQWESRFLGNIDIFNK